MANEVQAGNAIAGFDLEIAAGDVVVGPGLINGVSVGSYTLDVSALALGDGTHAIVFDGTDVVGQLDATPLAAGEIKLGEFVEATAAATSVTFNERGNTLLVTVDDTVSAT